jgi:bromodomain-containing factor 1
MAIMATEEPQIVPLDQKAASTKSVDEMALDEPVAPALNGHAEAEQSRADDDSAPVVNGKAKSPDTAVHAAAESHNRDAFAANGSISEQLPSDSISEQPKADLDTKMTDVVNTSEVDNMISPTTVPSVAEPATVSEKAVTTASPVQDTKPAESTATQPDPETSFEASMDVDTSTEQPELTPSAGQAGSTQATAISDEAVAASPGNSSQQPADLSKLDIQTSPNDGDPVSAEVSMADHPTSPSKVTRARDDDDVDEPASKRARTEEGSEPVLDSQMTLDDASPAPATGSVPDTVPDDQVITPFQNKQLRTQLAGLKKTKNGMNFRYSVEKLWPSLWGDYTAKVQNPVDLAFFELKLREDKYKTFGEFKTDVRLLHANAYAYNGATNGITNAAAVVRDQILARLPEVANSNEPVKLNRGKVQPTRHTEPRAATQPRRQSQPQAQQAATTPKIKTDTSDKAGPPTPASATAPAFALPPNGIPQIRRDSTRDDGDRPKRPIHPPKNRDLDYGSKANRKKKMDPDQRFHDEVLSEVKKGKYFHLNQWFMDPVDPVALNIPTYFNVIKKPMDLNSMTQKNYEGNYKNTKELEKDMKQIVTNAETFNGHDHEVSRVARELEDLFKAEVAKKDQWMRVHYPPEASPTANASAASPERSAHESEDESEAEDEDEPSSEAIRNLQQRLIEEQDKLNTLMTTKKPDLTMIEIQQGMVSLIQRKLIEEKTKFHDEKKPKAKKKSSSKSKSKPNSSSAAAASSKKVTTNNTPAPKKAASGGHKKSAPKKRMIGQLEKAVIADGIGELDGATLTKAVEIIKRDTGQNENDDGEMELDIEILTNEALIKLYDLIHKANPHIRAVLEKKPEHQAAAEPEPKARTGGPSKSKKNKPMGKAEQERKIEQLRELKAQLQRQGSGSQEPLPGQTEEDRGAESSEEDESDSEEE